MEWYVAALNKYAQFSGRSRRKEYWFFVLFNLALVIGLAIVAKILDVGFLRALYGLFMLIPALAVSVRRLHDTGRSGWWLLLSFIPVLGWIALLVFYASDSEPGTNQYGPNPKMGEFGADGVAFS